jgi:hypothetical protein
MLVVMLILMTATAMAAVSLQSTQYELRASGYNRAALQTQYVSEAAAETTLAWVDATAMDHGFMQHLAAWNLSLGGPDMRLFGEPALTASNRRDANRTQWRQQALLTNTFMPPITRPTEGNLQDATGTFGPRSPYFPGVFDENAQAPAPTDYVVDMYDCRQLPNTGTAGSQVNQGGSGTLRPFQYYCVVTARGGAYVPGAPSKTWTLQGVPYRVWRLAMRHDSRGTIVTPPMFR